MASSIEISEETERKLREIAAQSGRPLADELQDSVSAWHRSLVGDSAEQLGIPFRKRYADRDADIVLRQVTSNNFHLEESFRFQHPSAPDVVVERGGVTDLASVPRFLTWLVPRYGRHSLPALLHDQLVVEGMDPDVREQADTTLREAMGSTKVPLVRRWSMWAAVSVATHWLRPLKSKVLVVVWILLYLAAAADILLRLFGRQPIPAASSGTAIAIIVVSPVVLSVVWGRRYLVGLITAYSILVLLAPLAVVLLTLLIYWLAEGVAQVILKVMRRKNPSVRINPVRLSKL